MNAKLIQKLYSLSLAHNKIIFQNCKSFSNKYDKIFEEKPEPKKKKVFVPRITLISSDESISITTLDEAKKLSARRDLKLVKILDLDTKTQRPVYRLMTGTQYYEEDLKRRSEKKASKSETSIKGEKMLAINAQISDNDLNSRIKNITRWLQKHYQVQMTINAESSNMETCEEVYKKLESQLSTFGRFLQKRSKGSQIKFHIQPNKPVMSNVSNTEQPQRSFHTQSNGL